MKSKYYRLTCVGIGIYEYLKKYIWNNYQEPVKVWNDFISDDNVNWLKRPSIYSQNLNCYSYFTRLGYMQFKKKTLPIIKNFIDINCIFCEVKEFSYDDIIYEDEYQIVIKNTKFRKIKGLVVLCLILMK